MNKITSDMTIAQVLQANANAGQILRSFGMHCIGCSVSTGESLEAAAEVHGIDLQQLLDALNK
ncbi:MAG: DUF1858 domain-containing protein [Candidatus Riflebacteria bacterium]|nr:DUF1858 domain-containing protein [Candidatus Riflebacteria bacterium]